jgi:capsular polysaccharide biosynthesis protein
MTRPLSSPTPPGVDWFESEQSTRMGLITELQRIQRRTWVRPIPVLLLATLITAGITYKVATKPVVTEAEIVLALIEGQFSSQRSGSLPVDQLREYVSSILLPDNQLIKLIEKHNLFRLRKKLGPQFALEELRSNLEIQIWKNSFVYYDEDESNARRSARIGITVRDSDPDRAFAVAQDLVSMAIANLAAQRQKVAQSLARQVEAMHAATEATLDRLALEYALKQAAIDDARRRDRPDLAAPLRIDQLGIMREQRRAEQQLTQIATSPEALATAIADAGLDMSLTVVGEHRPERPNRSPFALVMVAVVVGAGALIGAMLVVGAFDSRVHDTDDVARLGLPVLGQVPRFAGDNVGSMLSRGGPAARVPSFLRWRSHR